MIRKAFSLFGGLFLFSLGLVLTIKSDLGTAPWDVLHLGLINYLPLTFGQISQLTGIIVIILSWFLDVKPGWGTLANMYFIGLFVDIIITANWIPTVGGWFLRSAMLLIGVWMIGWASYFYLSAALGTGPRDSFMVGAIKKSGWPVWKVRTVIEASVAAVGYFLGGPVGIGTIIIVFTLGPSIQWAFSIMGRRAEDIKHSSIESLIASNSKGSVTEEIGENR